MNVLLWKIGALGDVLMTTPLVRRLRRAFPRARIDYLTGSRCAGVLQGNPHLDRVASFDERILFGAEVRRLPEVVRALKGYDAVFVLDKHWIFELLAWTARIPVRVGFQRRRREGFLHTHRVAYGPLRHEILYYLDLANAWGVAADDGDVRLELQAPAQPADPSPPVVLINSGGSNAGEDSQVRRMPDVLFGAMVEHFGAIGPIAFLGSHDERAYYERYAGGSRTNLCGRTSLAQAWSALAGARAVYATDSGLMHMAGALNGRLTAIFGPTHPARKCPPGAKWAWADAGRYDARYEVFGTPPREGYFTELNLAQILEASPFPPLSQAGQGWPA